MAEMVKDGAVTNGAPSRFGNAALFLFQMEEQGDFTAIQYCNEMRSRGLDPDLAADDGESSEECEDFSLVESSHREEE
jgi:hypothetical protein